MGIAARLGDRRFVDRRLGDFFGDFLGDFLALEGDLRPGLLRPGLLRPGLLRRGLLRRGELFFLGLARDLAADDRLRRAPPVCPSVAAVRPAHIFTSVSRSISALATFSLRTSAVSDASTAAFVATPAASSDKTAAFVASLAASAASSAIATVPDGSPPPVLRRRIGLFLALALGDFRAFEGDRRLPAPPTIAETIRHCLLRVY